MRRAIGTSFLVIGLVLLSAPLTWTSAGADGGAAVSGDAPVVEADGVSGDDLAVQKPKKQTDPKPKATPTPKVTPTPTPEVTPTPTPEVTPTPTPEVTPTPTPEITPTPTPTPTVTPTPPHEPPHEPPPPELPHTGVKTDIAAIGLTMLAVGVLFIWRSQERAIRLG